MKSPALAAYGMLGLPLAMAMLPIYVLVPNFYAVDLGLGLTLTGAVLFLARLLDTVQDPGLAALSIAAHHVAGPFCSAAWLCCLAWRWRHC